MNSMQFYAIQGDLGLSGPLSEFTLTITTNRVRLGLMDRLRPLEYRPLEYLSTNFSLFSLLSTVYSLQSTVYSIQFKIAIESPLWTTRVPICG